MGVADPEHDGAFAPQLTAARAALSAGLRADVRLTAPERLSEEGRRNLLLRCRVTGASEGPASVILKQVTMDGYDPDAADSWDLRRFFGDWAGAAFLDAVAGDSHGPRFHGGDRSLGLIILEDLGEHRSLVEPLLADDAAAAEQALLALAVRLGAMHAGTIGATARFEAIARALRPDSDVAATCRRQAAELRELAGALSGQLERLGSPAVPGFAGELDALCEAVADPGPFLAYVHGDPCPDNIFYSGGRARLIDFEFGGFGHALRDGVYARMQFPSCWCANRLPEALVGRFEATYRAELALGCPAAQDDRTFEEALAVMSGYWLITSLAWLLGRAIDEDTTWGIATARSRIVARLEAFTATPGAAARLPSLHGAADTLRETLRRRWPDVPPLPLYPAFR